MFASISVGRGDSVDVDEERTAIEAERARSQRVVQVALGVLALGSILFGLTVYALANQLGLPEETAKLIASAFLIAASLDALVLYGWERLFGRHQPTA